jgi:hypothetical protein
MRTRLMLSVVEKERGEMVGTRWKTPRRLLSGNVGGRSRFASGQG